VDNNRIEQTAAEWLAQHDGGNWSEGDQSRLSAWLAAATAHRVAWLRLQAAWREAGRLQALGAGIPAGTLPQQGQWSLANFAPNPALQSFTDARQQLDKLQFAPRKPAKPVRVHRYAALAGLLLLAVGFTGWGWFRNMPVEQAVYTAAIGELRSFDLGDGSRLTLSSGSRVAVSFSRAKRRLDLQQGEAFFDVAKDPARPFVVNADARSATAVGTRFSVRRETADIRVVVVEGTVKLEDGAQPAHTSALLPAGSIAVAGSAGVQVNHAGIEAAEHLLDWRSGFLSFRDTPLAEAATEFNRYNARQIVLADNTVAALRIGGNFRWTNADAFVRLLEQGFPVRAEFDGDRIVLHGR
jgi:transmembrane sensor